MANFQQFWRGIKGRVHNTLLDSTVLGDENVEIAMCNPIIRIAIRNPMIRIAQNSLCNLVFYW